MERLQFECYKTKTTASNHKIVMSVQIGSISKTFVNDYRRHIQSGYELCFSSFAAVCNAGPENSKTKY